MCLELDCSEVRCYGVKKRVSEMTEVVTKSCEWSDIYPFAN